MKFLKLFSILAFTLALTACGHPYEGTFERSTGIKTVDKMAAASGGNKVVIGDNFIEADGTREEFDDIFVRESAGGSYLVFKRGDTEGVWGIVDDDTLQQDMGLFKVTLKRID